jgi:uncharacterized membrane protein YdjX (TVP38/TMEM64 family)
MNLKDNKWQLLAVAVVFCLAAYFLTVGRGFLEACLTQLRAWGPTPFFAVFAVCISFGVPPIPFLLAAGAAFGLGTNLLGFVLSYAVSLVVAYLWAKPLFKSRLDEFMTKKSPMLADVLRENSAMATVLVRLTPGIPYVVQNCLLATICRSLKSFVFLSLAPAVVCAMLFATLGKSLQARNYGLLLFVVAALAGIVVFARVILRRRSQARRSANPSNAP